MDIRTWQLGAAMVLVGALLPVQAAPPPLPPLPAALPGGRDLTRPAASGGLDQRRPIAGELRGDQILINGRPQRVAWIRRPGVGGARAQIWLPLDLLQGQLGFSSKGRPDGGLDLQWFGTTLPVPRQAQLSLADEVGVDAAPFLEAAGVRVTFAGPQLQLVLPGARLMRVRRSSAPAGTARFVLDLSGPLLVRQSEAGLQIGLQPGLGSEERLRASGLGAQAVGDALLLAGPGGRPLRQVFSLGAPARLVIDWADGPPGAVTPGEVGVDGASPGGLDRRLQSLLGSQLRWDRQVRVLDGRRVRLNAVRLDPRLGPVALRPLSRGGGMEGLSLLPQLARRYDAVVAINGGFFNRVRRLPLGAIKDQGRWLSGPILNRGVVAWDPRQLPRFGRLQLEEWVSDSRGQSLVLQTLNSGYVQRGLSRYTADWGPVYRPLSGFESAVLIRQGLVAQRFEPAILVDGVNLGPLDTLLVARGRPLPWREGDRLTIKSRTNSDLGLAANVVGGGPLLLQQGQLVLDGSAEGFGAAFLSQGAPRTVIGSDGRLLWLVTLEGIDDSGPTLTETARLLQAMGLQEALNLDGGSSTGLVMGGTQTVRGRGVTAAVHNGLGLVPLEPVRGPSNGS